MNPYITNTIISDLQIYYLGDAADSPDFEVARASTRGLGEGIQ